VAATGPGAGVENKEENQPSNCYFGREIGYVPLISRKDLLITLAVCIGAKSLCGQFYMRDQQDLGL